MTMDPGFQCKKTVRSWGYLTFVVVAVRQADGHPHVVAEGEHGCAFRDSHVSVARVNYDSVGKHVAAASIGADRDGSSWHGEA
jgi:hypothetical protein